MLQRRTATYSLFTLLLICKTICSRRLVDHIEIAFSIQRRHVVPAEVIVDGKYDP